MFFETEDPDWQYATDGGTAFIVRLGDDYFGITCKHCLGSFNWRQLALTDSKFGENIAGLKSIFYPSNPTGGAVDSDILDVVVIQFAPDASATFFEDQAYIIDQSTVTTSNSGDKLQVNGALKDKSRIGDSRISPQFALLEFDDQGPSGVDPALRHAYAKFGDLDFNSLTGLSGSPVFNVTQEKLAGVVVRGNLSDGVAKMLYVDFGDVMQLLKSIAAGQSTTSYNKTVVNIAKLT